MSTRNYTAATEAAIFAMSLKCYYPECGVPSVNILRKGEAKKNVQIAHIVPISPAKPRYRKIPEWELNGFGNLILLCDAHHPPVDSKKNENQYTEAVLHRWKQENEADLRAKVDGLDRLTVDDLNDVFEEAIAGARDQILGAIEELQKISEGSAELIRDLFNKMEDYYVNQESAKLLYAASERLTHLQDSADMLYTASGRLYGLSDTVDVLASSFQKMEALEGWSANLRHAAEVFDHTGFYDKVDSLNSVSGDLERSLSKSSSVAELADSVSQAGDSVVTKIEEKVRSIERAKPPVVVDDAQRWNFAMRGFAAGVAACVVLVVAMAIWYSGSLGAFLQK